MQPVPLELGHSTVSESPIWDVATLTSAMSAKKNDALALNELFTDGPNLAGNFGGGENETHLEAVLPTRLPYDQNRLLEM